MEMLILGIDPGSVTTGYGIIDHQGSMARYIASGSIRIGKYELPERLKQIFNDLTQIVLQYKPTQVAVEKVFVHKTVSSALKLGQARGVAIAAVACQDLSIAEYSAREVKQAIVGYGNADKTQVQMMVKTILRLNGLPAADAADALAIALCHGNSNKYRGQIA
jgi:crossover junction endodeoxyribonuclease RuvC